jgi:DNA modification methylase
MGAGTTALVAKQEGRQYVGFELNKKYVEMAEERLSSFIF